MENVQETVGLVDRVGLLHYTSIEQRIAEHRAEFIIARGMLVDFPQSPHFQLITAAETLRHGQNTVRQLRELAHRSDAELAKRINLERLDLVSELIEGLNAALGAVGFATSRV